MKILYSVLLAGTYRKRLQIGPIFLGGGSGNITEYWIEGMGSTHGLFGAGYSVIFLSDFSGPLLSCFTLNDTTIYRTPDPFVTSCYQNRWVSLPEFAEELNLYPNPAKDFVLIERAQSQPISVRVYSLSGVFLKTFSLAAGEQKIELPKHWQGLYILEISSAIDNSPPVYRRILVN